MTRSFSSVRYLTLEPHIGVKTQLFSCTSQVGCNRAGQGRHMSDTAIILVIFALGFAAGYGVREQMSRQRHRRARERAGH